MDNYSFGLGIFIAVMAGLVAVFIGAIAYNAGKHEVFTDIKHYGCERVVEIHTIEGKR